MYIAVRYSVCICRCVHTPGEPSEVINEDAEQAFIDATGEQPLPGGRRVDTWSMCFQGGTFDRVKERCGSSLSVAAHHVCAWIHIPSCTFHITYSRYCMSDLDITRCSGDFPQVKMSKYTMGLPGLPDKVIDKTLPTATTVSYTHLTLPTNREV